MAQRPSSFYGLPKVHDIVTDNIPKCWSILWDINTPFYKLANILISILSLLRVNDYTLKGSFSFAKEVNNFNQQFMACLDIELLFINISIDEIINNEVEDLLSNNTYHKKLSKST